MRPFPYSRLSPHMGTRCRLGHPELRSARYLRMGGFEKILVFYRPLGDVIEIVRVLHGSQDLDALFEREGVQ
jgi:plasmid stabilization system protein ParE